MTSMLLWSLLMDTGNRVAPLVGIEGTRGTEAWTRGTEAGGGVGGRGAQRGLESSGQEKVI